jgi:hypothetical protein
LSHVEIQADISHGIIGLDLEVKSIYLARRARENPDDLALDR